TKIARRSVWMAVGASARSATVCVVVSRVGGFSNLTLPERRSLSRHPWDLEARARRNFGRQHPILDRNAAQLHAATATALACAGRRLRLARLLHAAGLDRRPALQALQPRDLLAQRRILCRQTRHLAERLDQQASQLVSSNPIKIWWRPGHGHHRIVILSSWEVPRSPRF